jgi:hypothetical protein
MHPMAPAQLPSFVPGMDGSDGMLFNTGVFLIIAISCIGILIFMIHAIPEKVAHRSRKAQMEIVSVLCLLSLLSHNHIFWVIGLFLAFVDFPKLGEPFSRIAVALERIGDRRDSPSDRGSLELSPVADGQEAEKTRTPSSAEI